MTNVRIKINEAELGRAGQDIARVAQAEVDRALHRITNRVGREMAGEPEDDVYERLVSEMRKDLGASVTGDNPHLRRIAAEISADERAEG